jgi:hypothetical protein
MENRKNRAPSCLDGRQLILLHVRLLCAKLPEFLSNNLIQAMLWACLRIVLLTPRCYYFRDRPAKPTAGPPGRRPASTRSSRRARFRTVPGNERRTTGRSPSPPSRSPNQQTPDHLAAGRQAPLFTAGSTRVRYRRFPTIPPVSSTNPGPPGRWPSSDAVHGALTTAAARPRRARRVLPPLK